MKILVNGTTLLSQLTGIGQYVRLLFSAMGELPEAQLLFFYGLQQRAGLPDPPLTPRERSIPGTLHFAQRLIPKPRTLKRIFESMAFQYFARKDSASIYHEPNFIPHCWHGPTVITVHDLSCFDHPETHPEERVRIMQKNLPAAIQKADHIIVISEATRKAVRDHFSLPDERVTVTPLAAGKRFRPMTAEETAPLLQTFGLLPGKYILAVGTLEPRKNLPILFDAYARLPDMLRKRFPLVVAGKQGWLNESLLKSAQYLVARGELRFVGYVNDLDIPALYAGAAVFVYPSRYEGFGLPPLEAMASGVPVITANRTSLPEVVGHAGILLDPDDTEGFSHHLRTLLEDHDLAVHLARLGIARAKEFSWERCARQTFSVYQHVLQQHSHFNPSLTTIP